MLSSVIAGLGLGFSLIVAIGAQNLFVLRQGIRGEHALVIAALCAVSDAVLIAVGVAGLGLILSAVPWLVGLVRWAGFSFLLGYGLLAARRALHPTGEARRPSGDSVSTPAPVAVATRTRLAPVALTCLALTWLNPHVYLDTVFLLGSIASTHGELRWWFAGGAIAASVVWFFALALGARHLGRWLATPRAWRVLDAVIAVIMIALGISFVLPH